MRARLADSASHDSPRPSLRWEPWDAAVDPLGRGPLKPFERSAQLVDGMKKIFKRVDPQLGDQFNRIDKEGLLDLESRKGKAPGGYQNTLSEARKPFIFMNAVGVDDDVRTLLHEGGHAFHALACAKDPLVDYRHGPMEQRRGVLASEAIALMSSLVVIEAHELGQVAE